MPVRTLYTLSPQQWWGRVATSVLLTATGCAFVDTAVSLTWSAWLFVVGLIATGLAAVLAGMAFLSWRQAALPK